MSCLDAGSKDEVASSTNQIRFFWTKPRARAIRWTCPPKVSLRFLQSAFLTQLEVELLESQGHLAAQRAQFPLSE